MPRRSHVAFLSYRRASPAEAQNAGLSPGTKAYVQEPTGAVVSNRTMQRIRNKLTLGEETSPERGARIRAEQRQPHTKLPGQTVKSHFAHSIQRHPPAFLAHLEGKPIGTIKRDEGFKALWESWHDIEPRGRLEFMQAFKLVEQDDAGEWVT